MVCSLATQQIRFDDRQTSQINTKNLGLHYLVGPQRVICACLRQLIFFFDFDFGYT